MKLLILVFLFFFSLSGITQKNTFKAIIFPANEKNNIIYDQPDENSFRNLVSEYIKNNYKTSGRLDLLWLEDLYYVTKDHVDLEIEPLGNKGENQAGFFFSTQIDLYIFQQKDSISGDFRDISYEFWFKGTNQYTKIIGIYVEDLNTDKTFKTKSITENTSLFSLQDEYRFDEKKNQENFSYHFIKNLDSDVLRNNQPVSMRMKHYSEKEMKMAYKHQYILLDDLKTLWQNGALSIKSKSQTQFRNIDSSYNYPFRYSMPGSLQPIMNNSGGDSIIEMPDGSQLVQYFPRKEFNLENKYLREVKIYERGIFDPQTNTWIYQPYAVSPIFIVDGQNVKGEYEEFWILFSDFEMQKSKVNESTYWWFEIVKKFTGGIVLFEFEPK